MKLIMENWKRFLKESAAAYRDDKDEWPEDEAPDDSLPRVTPDQLRTALAGAQRAGIPAAEVERIQKLAAATENPAEKEIEVDLDEVDIDIGDIDLDDGGIQKDIDKIVGILQAQGLDQDSDPNTVTDALNYLLTDHPDDAVEHVRKNWHRITLPRRPDTYER
jgi:hypothetical protein